MVKLLYRDSVLPVLLSALALLVHAPTGGAATVSAGHASGAPGETATVLLHIDDTPLDGSGSFTLDLDLSFDGATLTVLEIRDGTLGSSPQRDFFFGPTAALPQSSSPILLDFVASFNFGSPTPSPGGGTLAEIDVAVAPTAAPGQILPLELAFMGGVEEPVLVNGSITVVPVPAAAWFMMGGIGALAAARRRCRAPASGAARITR